MLSTKLTDKHGLMQKCHCISTPQVDEQRGQWAQAVESVNGLLCEQCAFPFFLYLFDSCDIVCFLVILQASHVSILIQF